jgi:hypothetical protein
VNATSDAAIAIVCNGFSMRLLSTVRQQIDAGEHGDQNQVASEEAEEIRGLGDRFGASLRGLPGERDQASGNNLRNGPPQIEPWINGSDG